MASRVHPIGAGVEDLVDGVELKEDAVLFELAGLRTCLAFDSDLGPACWCLAESRSHRRNGELYANTLLHPVHSCSLQQPCRGMRRRDLACHPPVPRPFPGGAEGHDRNARRENAGGSSVSGEDQGGGSGVSCWDNSQGCF